MRILLSSLLITLFTGCSTVSTMARPDVYYAGTSAAEPAGSLFASDAGTLTDEDIERILKHDYTPPALSRIALMPFGRETWSGWSEELALANEEMEHEVINRLRMAPTVYDASYLPSILIPENRTVPHLREAAARYQADLLLVYRSYCTTFERYRLFRANQSRAWCGVEAVLLDTSSGLVPFTSVSTESYDVVATGEDYTFRETQLRGQLSATAAALGEVSEAVVRYLAETA